MQQCKLFYAPRSNWVKKVLIYEQNPGNGDYDYLTRNFLNQADEAQIDDYAGLISYCYPGYFNNTIIEEIPSAYDPSPGIASHVSGTG